MPQTVFADGIADIVIIGGVVRIEFFTAAPNRDAPPSNTEGPNLSRVPTITVAMPLPGFAGALSMLDGVRKRMITEGVIKSAPEERDDASSPKVKSKNFT